MCCLVAAVDDDVAWKQGAEVGFGRERAVSKRRVARAEDQIRLFFDAEFLAQGGLHVDLAEDAESLRFEFVADALDGRLE